MIFVLTGAPGAGKGTQADLLRDRFGFRKVSTGDAIRNQIKLGTEVGQEAKKLVDNGKLVPDEVLRKLLEAELGNDNTENILLDGYPRNVAQAEQLESLSGNHDIAAIIQMNVETQELVRRISGRRICPNCAATYHLSDRPSEKEGVCDKCGSGLIQRPDDNEEKVKVRLDVYADETKPILDYYSKSGRLREISGLGSVEDIFSRLKSALEEALGKSLTD